MIVVMTKFPINPEYAEEFREYAVNRFGEKGLKEQEGFIKMKILSPVNFPPNSQNNIFIIETYWRDMESLKKYTESEAFRKAHENPPPKEWFSGHPVIEVYNLIKEI
ncbi:Heme-degrading monooxygenase HmoA [Persephonella hydrogeniphila]|uniref:Heme-degrading monooxygenase HmoA n=1 Tax=Persephonella hydrogeniphila TaxID=198703 RepID=A0A285NFD8_9AQUI|nr:antibiotic biosynthesis monooxygenase family protein [Persephonella hydrogeniphila]SNZ07988.1 Heme-degrading monooxygenase HmoA [Persephonella hydrogeniphila]